MLIAPTWLQIRTSNLRITFPGTVRTLKNPLKNFQFSILPRVTFPLYFWALSANRSNAVKVTDFVFDSHVPRDTLDMNPLKFSEKRAWPGTHDPSKFGGLNANCSNMV